MENQHLDKLIEKYILKTATVEEQQELLDWYNGHNDIEVMWSSDQLNEEVLVKRRLLANINERIQPKAKSISLWPRIAAVAAAVAMIVFGVWFFNSDKILRDALDDKSVVQNDVAPGKNGATITLANGKVIQLSDAKTGVVIGEDLKYSDGTEILRSALNDKKLDDKGGVLSSRVSRDLVASTAKGQTYQFTLPDGTKIWLNSDSKLDFPSNFRSVKQRIVKLTGEGYFEVAKDRAKPFIVESRGQEVEVLGTKFNINSYADEPSVATTLVEGSVKVTSSGKPVLIKPGEQALNKATGITVSKVNIDNVTDWQSGDFYLNKVPFKEAMRKIARWYDVEVVYADDLPADIESNGYLSRDTKLSVVLKAIEKSGQVHFRVENRKIYVSK